MNKYYLIHFFVVTSMNETIVFLRKYFLSSFVLKIIIIITIARLYSPLRAKANQQTLDLSPTCPRREAYSVVVKHGLLRYGRNSGQRHEIWILRVIVFGTKSIKNWEGFTMSMKVFN